MGSSLPLAILDDFALETVQCCGWAMGATPSSVVARLADCSPFDVLNLGEQDHRGLAPGVHPGGAPQAVSGVQPHMAPRGADAATRVQGEAVKDCTGDGRLSLSFYTCLGGMVLDVAEMTRVTRLSMAVVMCMQMLQSVRLHTRQ